MSVSLREYRPSRKPKPRIGFWKLIGVPARGPALHAAIKAGMPYTVYKKLARETGLEQKELAEYTVIKPATLQRRAKDGRFKPEESDRLYRFAEVYKAALDLFEGDAKAARRWLDTPVKGLGGRRPLEMVSTSAGSKTVLDLIGRLEHGIVS